MADLWDRLRAVQQAATSAPPPREEPSRLAPPGWVWLAPLVAERRFTFPLEHRFWAILKPSLDPTEWDQVLCFDTETTGLSGGAGTVAFLIGWARLLPSPEGHPEVEVRQWFLRDHPGEPDLIEFVDAALNQARGLVSYNGASFDLPLLKSRWAMAGKPFPDKPHRDDLHPSRRLWKRLMDSCRLARIEANILGVQRQDDVPGALVPTLWYDYLRGGAGPDFGGPLEGVLRHHAQDVYSLLCLDLLLGAVKNNPSSSLWQVTTAPVSPRVPLHRPGPGGLLHPDLGKTTPVDFWGILRLKEPSAADESLEEAWDEGDEETVGLAWADRLKRQNDTRAVAIWTRLWETKRSFRALEELVKWLEHRDRSPEARIQALFRIEEALKAPFLPRSWREALEKRRDRLNRSLT